MPDLAALELLLAVANRGSIGQAARDLGISQPSATARMQLAERLLGLALIERSPRGSRLTPAGVLVADWARAVVSAAQALDAGAAALRTRSAGQLRLGASLTIAEYLLPGWLVALRRRLPDTAVSLEVVNSTEAAGRVRDGEVDLGFVEGPTRPRGLASAVIAQDRLCLVVPPDHPWARRRTPLPAATLAATPLIGREAGSGTRQALAHALRAFGPPAPPLFQLSSTTAVKAAVAAGAGPAVLSSLAVADEVADGRLALVPVADLDLSRRLRAIWPAGQVPTGPARELLALARPEPRRGKAPVRD